MTNLDSKQRSKLRIYLWAKSLLNEEVNSGFPLLSVVHGTISYKFAEFLESLSPNERQAASIAIVKASNRPLLELLGEKLTDQEAAYRQSFLEHDKFIDRNGLVALAQFGSQREADFYRGNQDFLLHQNGRQVLKLLRPRAESLFGPANSASARVMSFSFNIGNASLSLVLDSGRRHSAISYFFGITSSDLFANNLSYLSVFGIAGETCWNLFSESEQERVAEAIFLHLNWFRAKFPLLIGP
jgi:hypothetical protein